MKFSLRRQRSFRMTVSTSNSNSQRLDEHPHDNSDNDSTSSTFSALPSSSKLGLPQSSILSSTSRSSSTTSTTPPRASPATPIKRVCFDDHPNTQHSHPHKMTRDELRALWYTGQELKMLRKDYGRAVKRVLREDDESRATGSPLQQIYQSCCHVSCEEIMENEVQCEDEGEILNQWLLQRRVHDEEDEITCRHGLAQVSNRYLLQDKSFRRIELWDTLCWTQQQQDGQQNRDYILHHACQTISRPSRLLARRLAIALENDVLLSSSF